MIVDFSSLYETGRKDVHTDSLPRLFRYEYHLEFYDRGRRRRFEMNTNLICYTIEQGRKMIYDSVQPDDRVDIISEQCICDRLDGMSEEIVNFILRTNKKVLDVKPITSNVFQKLGKVEEVPNSIQVRSVKTNISRTPTIDKDRGEKGS